MSYVQIVEFVTHQPDKLKALGEKYLGDSDGQHMMKRWLVYHDRAEARRYVAIIEFESRENALENDNLPETEDFAEALAELADGPISRRNLELAGVMLE